jgi:steroid delta-isomerase-like uncharacterized protein
MSAQENKAVLQRAVAYLSDPENRDAYFNLYDDNCVLHGYGLPPGIEAIKGFYRVFWDAFPDAQLTIEDLVAEDDKVACRFSFTATHAGDFLGIPPTGKRVTVTGITILRFANGKCVERWSSADFLSFLQQVDALPAPP